MDSSDRQHIGFDVDNGNDELFVEWIDVYPLTDADDVEVFSTHLARLEEFKETERKEENLSTASDCGKGHHPPGARSMAVLKLYVHFSGLGCASRSGR